MSRGGVPSWQRLVDAIAQERDDRRRRNLEVVARHVVAEVDGDIDALMGTLVDEPSYRIWGASDSVGPHGAEAVRAFYEAMVRSGKNRLEFDVQRVIVDDRHVVTEGEMRHAYQGSVLIDQQLRAAEPVVEDAWYLVAYQALIVWPLSDDGRLEGEDIYAGEAPRVLRRLSDREMPHLGLPGR